MQPEIKKSIKLSVPRFLRTLLYVHPVRLGMPSTLFLRIIDYLSICPTVTEGAYDLAMGSSLATCDTRTVMRVGAGTRLVRHCKLGAYIGDDCDGTIRNACCE